MLQDEFKAKDLGKVTSYLDITENENMLCRYVTNKIYR